MKQVTQNMRDGKTMIQDIPTPTPQSGQALVKVTNSLVSAGTERMLVEFGEKSLLGKARSRPDLVHQVLDKVKREGLVATLEATFNRLDSPMPLGYSSSGVIIALGNDMEDFKIGQRVACSGGGYAVHAEYNLVPKRLLTPVPDEVDLESASFTTLGAIALHGFRLAENQVGENVAVIGLGLLGLMTIQIARSSGCNVFGIDPQPDRVEMARQFGAQASLRDVAVQAGLAFTQNRGFDSVVICADTSSNDPMELAGAIARDRAKVVATGAIGLTMPRKIYFEKELSFINSRSYGPGRYDPSYEEKGNDYPIGFVRWTESRNFEAIIGLIASGKLLVKPLITHRFEITDAEKAYALITGKTTEKFLGVVLNYASTASVVGEKIQFKSNLPSQDRTIKLGIIGAGLYANATLLPVLKNVQSIQCVGISSSNGLNAAHSAKKFGFDYACSGDEQIIQDPSINTVVVLTRHNSHANLAIKSLRAGKNVFVEKPLALSQIELDLVVKELSSAKGILTVGFNRRFAPLVMTMREYFTTRAEPLFAHYRVNAGYLPLNHWTQDPQIGGGRIIGEACHFIDLITSLVGSVPTSITAHAMTNNGKYNNDNVSMTITFGDGSIGVIDYLANGDKSFSKEYIEVFCGGRIAILNDFTSLELVGVGKRKRIQSGFRQDKGHSAEMLAFTTSINKGVPSIPYEQLIAVTKTTFAAVESLKLNSEKILI